MEYPIRILLVDDRPEDFLTIQALLVDTPYQLIRASSGMEALKFLLESEYALIIMDVLMPDMNGFETAERIKRRKKSEDIPIIFLTALTPEVEDYMKAYTAGGIDYLTKPFHSGVLRSKIEGFVRLYKARKELQIKTGELQKQTLELEDANRVLTQLKETAEVASRIKSGFLAMMSHEIRTPLNGIIALSDILMASDLKQDDAEMAEIIHTSGHALLSVINHILDFTKIESGKMELDYEPFNLTVCLKETMDLFRALARERNLLLETHIEPGIPKILIGDSNRLRQVLNNLIGNAVKFTETGSVKATVSQKRVDDKLITLEFIVEDTGIGIPADKMHHLFQPFTQIDATISRKFGGTGLGLSICKTLVNLMGGTIYARSNVEKGAVFVFTIQTGIPADTLNNPSC
ncbi:hybrid sensor histidine kinase/response regulator [Paenibacillus chitinolyticus]|uniref:Circadian input-output histidine kinase CikA n=1 Tax=Paenibacillus chitinolyticus TaxID=79263 RepID=A0A410WPP1_9BACL|nr:ATP-binding protein [Paenibacillus chitinolyticus]MCY9590932.1 ATP-binding protein [Paenibacillus chitinolyticus]MCY9597267.1 ATP-binding protein [Paenibacillus chitinolyticus]QAV16368.1 hybrid sensor histidine kinase/response regulator [Paenibacillus chitinolyticus]